MPNRNQKIIAGHYYHIFNRGVNRQAIFFEPANYTFFLHRMHQYLCGNGVRVLAYCLMPNHYHLLVTCLDDAFSNRMHSLTISYAKAINKRYQRVGPLFQGRYQDVQVGTDGQLLNLSRYIHLNPIKAKLVDRLEDWPYSSYPDYVGLRNGTLSDTELILEMMGGESQVSIHAPRQLYRDFVYSNVEIGTSIDGLFLDE